MSTRTHLTLAESQAPYSRGTVARSTKVTAADFKARCLQLMDDVQASGKSIVITKRGKPVAQLVPIVEEAPRDIFGCLAHLYTVDVGEPGAPVGDPEDWEALKEWDELNRPRRKRR